MARSMQIHVPNSPHSVAHARQEMADALQAWGVAASPAEDALVGDLLLIATELLSNAVKFSSSDVTAVLRWEDRAIRVTVTDSSPAPVAPRDPGPDAGGGRGLAIVAALATRWGQTPYEEGCKEVWAEVSVAPGAGASGRRSTTTAVSTER